MRFSLTFLFMAKFSGSGRDIVLEYGDSSSLGLQVYVADVSGNASLGVNYRSLYDMQSNEHSLQNMGVLAENWNAFGVTFDYFTGNSSLWLRDTIVNSTTVHSVVDSVALATSYDITIGKRATGESDGFNAFMGSLSCLQLYDKVLSRSEIQAAWALCHSFTAASNQGKL